MNTPLRLRFVSPVLMWTVVAVGMALAFHFLPNRMLFRRNGFTTAVFALTAVNWVYFFASALAVNTRAAQSAAAVNRLVTTGVYAKVRHPIYSADIFLAWGIFLSIPTLRVLVSAAWLTSILLIWMKLEEAAMLQKFGDEYARYRSATPMLIPRYFPRTNR